MAVPDPPRPFPVQPLGQAPAAELAVVGGAHAGAGGGFRFGVAFHQRDVQPGIGHGDRDAGAHGAAADHAHLAHRPGPGLRRRPGGDVFGVRQVPQRPGLRSLAQRAGHDFLPLQPVAQRQVDGQADRLHRAQRRQGAAGAALHPRGGGLEGGVVVAGHAAVGQARQRTGIGQAAGEGERGAVQVGGDLVQQAQAHGLVRLHRAAGGDQVQRGQRAGQARQALRAAGAGDQAEADLGEAEHRVGGGDAGVAGERGFAAAAEGGAVDRGDHRLAAGVQRAEEQVQGDFAGAVLGIGRVGIGDEGAAGAGQHGGAQAVVGFQLTQRFQQAQAHRPGQAVDRRMVHHDHGDVARPFEAHWLVVHRLRPLSALPVADR